MGNHDAALVRSRYMRSAVPGGRLRWPCSAIRKHGPQGWTAGGSSNIQVAGAGICFLYAFGVAYVLFSLLNKVYPLRVSAEDERIGLNMAQHGVSTALLDLAG